MRSLAVLVAAFALLAAIAPVFASEDCSGHGKLVGDTCQCEQPWPAEGQRGWTGPQCGIPVWGTPAAKGADLTAWCHDQQCHSLQAGGWACFAVRAPFQ